jgi:hypothetical protein
VELPRVVEPLNTGDHRDRLVAQIEEVGNPAEPIGRAACSGLRRQVRDGATEPVALTTPDSITNHHAPFALSDKSAIEADNLLSESDTFGIVLFLW